MLFGLGKREAILAAGFELFATRGFENASVEDIQQRAGIAMATLYKYFPNKELLVNEVYRELRTQLEDALSIGIIDEGSPRAQFHELWVEMASFHRKHPLAIPFLENRHHGAYLDHVSRVLERVPEPIVELIDRMSRNKIAKDLPRMILTTVIWGTFVELVKLESQGLLSLSKDTLKAAEDSTWDAVRADRTAS